MQIKFLLAILGTAVLTLSTMLNVLTQSKATPVLGSVAVAGEYLSTTTSSFSAFPTENNITGNTAPRTGTFGSVNITSAGGALGQILFYDATTSNILARTGQTATSTIVLATFPNNATVGTYTFDSVYKQGILMVTTGSPVASTTVTFR